MLTQKQRKKQYDKQHYPLIRKQTIQRATDYNRTHKPQRHKTEKKWRDNKTQRLHKYMGIVICPKCQTRGYLTIHSQKTITTQHHKIHGIVMHYLHKKEYTYCYISKKSLLTLLDKLQIENPYPNKPPFFY